MSLLCIFYLTMSWTHLTDIFCFLPLTVRIFYTPQAVMDRLVIIFFQVINHHLGDESATPITHRYHFIGSSITYNCTLRLWTIVWELFAKSLKKMWPKETKTLDNALKSEEDDIYRYSCRRLFPKPTVKPLPLPTEESEMIRPKKLEHTHQKPASRSGIGVGEGVVWVKFMYTALERRGGGGEWEG